jgi:serine/threonine-protein kinase
MSQFGKYQLLDQIGGGRLSQVFRIARLGAPSNHGHLPKTALKRVRPDVIGEPAFVQLVVREASLLARLSHPSLCQCQEMGVVDGSAFLTLDLVEGCTLRALMRRISRLGVHMPAASITSIGYQLTQVLTYLHEGSDVSLIHLDLSPQNVMITREGEVKLIDFGIARHLDGSNPPPLDGKIAGTVGYMSPEQARGRELDRRSDQFGLGILLYEMLSGRRAFRGNTRETWERLCRGEILEAEAALAWVPAEVRETVLRLLRPDPDERFPNMGAVLQRVEAAVSDPLAGRPPLATLVQRLLQDKSFDPFDVVKLQAPSPDTPDDIPRGEIAPRGTNGNGESYAEISIEVDQLGDGTPGSLVRAALPMETVPDSPFLETIGQARATAQIAR